MLYAMLAGRYPVRLCAICDLRSVCLYVHSLLPFMSCAFAVFCDVNLYRNMTCFLFVMHVYVCAVSWPP